MALSQLGHEWGQKKPAADFTYIDVASIENKRGVITDDFNSKAPLHNAWRLPQGVRVTATRLGRRQVLHVI